MEAACCVCAVETAKYRCPRCWLRYCSLICCTKHKEACAPKEAPESSNGFVKSVPGSDPINLKVDDLLEEDEETDRVSLQKLKMLGDSAELRHLLRNPHLRKLVSTLDQAENKAQALQQYMQEPLFVEFADTCLSIVNTDEKET